MSAVALLASCEGHWKAMKDEKGDILELVDEFKDLVLLELWVFFAQFDSLHVDCTLGVQQRSPGRY
jgi:hypothetical protein